MPTAVGVLQVNATAPAGRTAQGTLTVQASRQVRTAKGTLQVQATSQATGHTGALTRAGGVYRPILHWHRQAGRWVPLDTAGLTVDRANRVGVAESFWRWASLTRAQVDARMARVKALGARWFRMDMPPESLEKTVGATSWAQTDAITQSANAAGIRVVWCISTLPAHAAASWQVGPTTTAQRAAYADFASRAAARYKGQVAAWELWNEPNLSDFWIDPNVDQYGQLLAVTYPAMKAADPNTPIWTGGTAWTFGAPDIEQAAWYAALYAAGRRTMFDGVCVHPYADAPSAAAGEVFSNGNIENVLQVRATMNTYGDQSKPIIGTECGFPSNRPDVGETNQAAWMRLLYDGWHDQATGRGLTGPLFLYTLDDYGTASTPEETFGAYRLDGSRKPLGNTVASWVAGG